MLLDKGADREAGDAESGAAPLKPASVAKQVCGCEATPP
jgi:hypothetical protein